MSLATAAKPHRATDPGNLGGPRSRTRRLTAGMRGVLEAVLSDGHQLGDALLTDARLFVTPGGRLGSVIGDRSASGRLFDAGLLAAVYHENYRFLGRADAPGFVRVTEAGRHSLVAGRYRVVPA